MKREYFKHLDIVRIFACIAILFYHIGILKGGYLAVCIFFVLSGYLAVISLSKKDNINFKEYYLNRFKRLYIPLLLVTFVTVAIVSLLPNANWFNLKPEVTSILFGYNNFWQLSANADYFARTIASPLIHMWYMAIIIQFEILFPIIYTFIKRSKKIKPSFSMLITFGLSTISFIYFYILCKNSNIMVAYYNTFSRIFSLLLGVLFAIIQTYYKNGLPKLKNRKLGIYIHLVLITIMLIFIDSTSKLMPLSMLIVSIITIRLIDYCVSLKEDENKYIKTIANASYLIYLIQYPIIYMMQFTKLIAVIKIPLIMIIVFIISFLIKNALEINKESKGKIVSIIALIVLCILSVFGIYKYLIAKDYTKELKALELKMNENKQMSIKKQEEYAKKLEEENKKLEEALKNFDENENNLEEIVKNVPLVGVGDSIMLGALDSLYKEFPNGYFDAAVSRTDWEANKILIDIKNKGLLSDFVLFNLGTNGECSKKCKAEIFETLGDRKILWVNATKPDVPSFNTNLEKLVDENENVYLVDWITASKDHPEYFYADGIHLKPNGAKAYAKTIHETLYQVYLDELKKDKEKIINDFEKQKLDKITFIGNDLLLSTYELLEKKYSNSEFIIDSDYTYKSISKLLDKRIKNNELSNDIVFMFDKSAKLTNKDYNNLIKLCENNNIYIVLTEDIKLENKDIKIIDFTKNVKDYYMVDNIHLNEEGNKELCNLIEKNIQKD